MPPRIRIPRCLPGYFAVQRGGNVTPFLSFLAPALQTAPSTFQTQIGSARASSILSKLSGIPSSYNKRIRRGRGPSSGKGKTSGRGHKGQKQHGKVPAGFEGGQTPLHIVHGKRGFTNVHRADINTVPISRILSWIAQGRIDPNKTITVRELALSRCVSSIKDGVKLLASSRSHENSIDEIPPLDRPLHIVVSHASKQAIEAIEKAGGTVLTRYYTRFAIRKIIQGRMDPIYSLQSEPRHPPTAAAGENSPVDGSVLGRDLVPVTYEYRLPDATSRRDIEYYRDPAHRGYLSYQLQDGQNPSLYFKSVEDYRNFTKKSKEKKEEAKAEESALLW